MKTAYKFPGILRWYEVVEYEVEMLCPIRVAVETLKQYNGELELLISRTQMNRNFYFKQLEMRLQGMISAAVGGGVTKYYQVGVTWGCVYHQIIMLRATIFIHFVILLKNQINHVNEKHLGFTVYVWMIWFWVWQYLIRELIWH